MQNVRKHRNIERFKIKKTIIIIIFIPIIFDISGVDRIDDFQWFSKPYSFTTSCLYD